MPVAGVLALTAADGVEALVAGAWLVGAVLDPDELELEHPAAAMTADPTAAQTASRLALVLRT